MSTQTQVPKYLYRYDLRDKFIFGKDHSVEVRCTALEVRRTTPEGFVVHHNFKEKWIPKKSKQNGILKPFAFEDKKEAYQSFRYRTMARERHLRAELEMVEIGGKLIRKYTVNPPPP